MGWQRIFTILKKSHVTFSINHKIKNTQNGTQMELGKTVA